MHAPIAVDHLRHAEIHGGRHQRDRLVLAQAFHIHQETAHLAERILHGEIERRIGVDLALPLRTEFGEIVRMAEAGQHPIGFSLDQGVTEVGKGLSREIALLVQDDLKRARHRAFDRRSAQLTVTYRLPSA